jgi:hypothetical protein
MTTTDGNPEDNKYDITLWQHQMTTPDKNNRWQRQLTKTDDNTKWQHQMTTPDAKTEGNPNDNPVDNKD